MINHIKKLAIIEDAATDNVVVLSNISEGVDGASTFGYETEETVMTIEDGQTIHDAIEHTLDIRTIVPDSGDSQLQTWTDNLTKVFISAIGLDGGLLVGDATRGDGSIRFYKDDQFSERKAIKILATRKTIPGFNEGNGIFENGIWTGNNLLGMFSWADNDGNGIANGWFGGSSFVSASFSGGQQTLEADLTQRDFSRNIYFPFEDELITFSLNNDSRTGDYATEQISIEFRDATDSIISTSIETFSTTGRKSVTAIVPSNTVALRVQFSAQAATGTVTNIISDPALQLGTKTEYITE